MATYPLSSARPETESPLRFAAALPKRARVPMVTGLIVVLASALAAAVLFSQVGDRNEVLAVARPVAPGQVITSADLQTVSVSSDAALKPLGTERRASVVGQPAAVGLVPGTLLTQSQLGASSELAPGETKIGLALKPGQFPPGLAPGNRVRIVSTDPALPGTLVSSATVVSVDGGPANDADATIIGAALPAEALNVVAMASAADHVSVGLLPPGAP